MKTLRFAWLLLAKDARTEWRTGEITNTTLIFAVIVAVIVSMSFYYDRGTAIRMASGVLWITIAFSGVLIMTRLWARERESDLMRALLISPMPRASIYVGKSLGALGILLAVETILVPLVAVLFHIDLVPIAGELILLVGLGSAGFVSMGTLFSALTVQTSAREFVFTLVLFPLIAPALLCGVQGTKELMMGATFAELVGWIYLLLAFLVVSLAGGLLLFGSLTTD